MPRALAIETSSRTGSVAAVADGIVLAEKQFEHGLQHAAQIIPMIDHLCRACGWSPRELDQLYISAGPGSFTGLRIGITLAKTLTLSTNVKIVAVPTVRVLAENAPDQARNLIIVLDAKRDQIFTARFDRAVSPSPGGRGEGWIEREPAHLDWLAAVLARSSRPVHLLGEGLPFHQKFITAAESGIIQTTPDLWRPRASVVAQLGTEMARRGEFTDPDRLVPIYLRMPEAEEKFDANQLAKMERERRERAGP